VSVPRIKVRLGTALEVIRGASPRPKGDPKYFGGDIPWIMISDVTREPGKYLRRTRETVTQAGAEKSRYLPAGTLILSNSGTVCIPKILAIDGCIHDGFVAFPKIPPHIDNHYLYWFFEYIRPSIIEANRQGITQVNLNTGIVKEIQFPLVPLVEQRFIVGEIEKQLSRLDEAVANLRRVKANLERYIAAVLTSAVEGRLVPTEAELARSKGHTYETGAQLLQRVLKMRRDQWTGRGTYVAPAAPAIVGFPVLPEGWTWASVGQLNPANRPCAYGVLQPGENLKDGVPFVRVGDINDGHIEMTGMKRISPAIATAYPRTRLVGREVLLTLVGAIGRTAVVPESLAGGNVARAVGVLPISTPIDPHWVEIWFRSPSKVTEMTNKAHEVARKTLNLEDVRSAAIALPPVAEQHRIVAEVDQRLSVVREVMAQIQMNMKRAQALRQAVLAKAFGTEGC
jgi:type I restriction enzyme S subunit